MSKVDIYRYATSMDLTDEDMQEFIRLYKEEFGEEISLADPGSRLSYKHINPRNVWDGPTASY